MKKFTSMLLTMALVMNFFVLSPVLASDTDHWASESLNRWQGYDVIHGYEDGTLRPDQSITRAEMAMLLSNLLKFSESEIDLSFSDVQTGIWYEEALKKSYELGLITGYPDGTFRANEAVTREQAVTLLHRALGFGSPSKEPGFSDWDKVSDYAKPAVALFNEMGYISGYPDNSFAPSKAMTRGEIIKIIDTTIGGYIYQEGQVIENMEVDYLLVVAPNVILKNVVINKGLLIAEAAHGMDLSGTSGNGLVRSVGYVNLDDEIIALGSPGNNNNNNNNNNNKNNKNNNNTGNNGGNNPKESNDWVITWQDEFDGDSLDYGKWQHDIGNWIIDGAGNPVTSGWGNEELEYYTDDEANIFLEDGKLIIRAQKEQTTDDYGTYDYTSSKIKTKDMFSQTYGRYEMRAKLPTGQGFWPAFWLLPQDDMYGGWAASGEVDILEGWGSKPGTVSGAIHYGGVWPNNTYSGSSYDLPEGGTIDAFHTYALEWTPGEIVWLVDDVPYHTEKSWFSKDNNGETFSYPAPFDQPFFIIVNLAVGGWFDGAPSDETQFPSQMEIDYIRVYEKEDGYEKATMPVIEKEPIPEGAKEPTEDGNLIYNGTFTEPITMNLAGDQSFGDGWNFVHIADAYGVGSVAIDTLDDTNYAKVDITNGGTQNYAIQLIQETTLGKGRFYKLSFDAKASDNRTLGVKIGGGPSRSYANYAEPMIFNLTQDLLHYEKTFQMSADTDLIARLEFNLGLNTESVWLGNIRLEEVEGLVVDYDMTKIPLKDGNGIYNGNFDKETLDRLAYWHIEEQDGKAKVFVDETLRSLQIDVLSQAREPEDLRVFQKGVVLNANTTYALSFKASSDDTRSLPVSIVDEEGHVYLSEVISLTSVTSSPSIEFTVGETGTTDGILYFNFGGASEDVALDDVRLVATSIDYSNIDTYPIKNGDFDSGLDNWSSYIHGDTSAVVSVVSGEAQIDITSMGIETWSVQLNQGTFRASSQVPYILSFDAKTSVARNIEVLLDNSGYYRHFTKTLGLNTEWTHYEYEVSFTGDEDVSLKFLLGMTDQDVPTGSHTIWMDNVDLHVVGAPMPEPEPEPDPEPEPEPVVYGQVLNGTFDTDISNWEKYTNDGSNAEFTSVDGVLVTSYPAYAGWFVWSTQFFQEGIALEGGKTYTLSFDAKSNTPWDLHVEMNGMDPKSVTLDSEFTTYSYDITVGETNHNAKLNFLSGTNNMDGANFPAGMTISIDNVSIVEKIVDPEPEPVVYGQVLNGTFDTDISNWEKYTNDGSNAEFTSVDGVLVTSYPAYAGWFVWSTQFFQEGIALEGGKTYTLSFDAKSSTPWDLHVEMNGMDPKSVTLDSEFTTYSYDITVGETNLNAKLNFLSGTNNMDGADFPAGMTIYIDNVSIVEKIVE